MPALICVLIVVQMILDVFQLDLSLGAGLSVKNLMLYVVFGLVIVDMVLRRGVKFEMRALQLFYIGLVLYAIFTWYLAFAYIEYDRYPILENGLFIKSILADFLVYFMVCFYGLRTQRDVTIGLNTLMIALTIANLITVTETFNITSFGVTEIREDGRVQGAMGEANQYAAFLSLTIPVYIALIVLNRGFWRLVWLGSVLLAMVAMLTTVSRGGFIALAMGCLIGCFIFRRQIPVVKLLSAAVAAGFVAVVVLFTVSAEYRSLIVDRLFSESSQADLSGASGGRTEMWGQALGYMVDKPLTFITGFGWRAYWTMPFQVSPHNTYLNYWFNLGLIGLGFLLYSQVAVIRTAIQSAVATIDRRTRLLLIAFVFGTISLSIAIFFVELYVPWIYTWAMYGMMMRLAMMQRAEAPAVAPAAEAMPIESRAKGDRFGWARSAKPRRAAPT